MNRDYYLINLYDIDYMYSNNNELYILYQNGEILNINNSKGLNVELIFKDIIKDLNNKFLIIDDRYYQEVNYE